MELVRRNKKLNKAFRYHGIHEGTLYQGLIPGEPGEDLRLFADVSVQDVSEVCQDQL